MSRTFYCAHTTTKAYALVNGCTIVNHANGACCTGSFAQAAADTADRTDLPRTPPGFGIHALVQIGAFYHDIVGTLMQMNHLLGTFSCTLSAGDAFLLIHLCHADLIDVNCAKLTRLHTRTAANTTVRAFGIRLIGAAAAVAGHQSRPVWESLPDCHNFNPSFRTVYCAAAAPSDALHSAGSRHQQWLERLELM